MQTERRVAANPQTKPTDLGCFNQRVMDGRTDGRTELLYQYRALHIQAALTCDKTGKTDIVSRQCLLSGQDHYEQSFSGEICITAVH